MAGQIYQLNQYHLFVQKSQLYDNGRDNYIDISKVNSVRKVGKEQALCDKASGKGVT